MRKNLFRIGRKGRRGDENQLTEMLAYLLQEEPQCIAEIASELGIGDEQGWRLDTQRAIPKGFLDLTMYVPGRAIVIIESKLGSTTDYPQLSKYIAYARDVRASLKFVVLTTQHPHAWPLGIEKFAEEANVMLLQLRWQKVADALRRVGTTLPTDFVDMLDEEGLAMPAGVSPEDWEVWNRGNEVTRRLGRLLQEATPDLIRLVPGYKKSGSVVLSNNGLLYRLHHFDAVSFGAAFWPRRESKNGDAVVITYVLNTALPQEKRLAAGQSAVERAASEAVMMSGWSEGYVQRGLESRDVLLASDFEAQVQQLVAFVRESLSYFAELEYSAPPLPPSA